MKIEAQYAYERFGKTYKETGVFDTVNGAKIELSKYLKPVIEQLLKEEQQVECKILSLNIIYDE